MSELKETIKVEVVGGVVLEQDGKYLLVQEKQAGAYGLWNFPAGRVDVGESIEAAAIREAKEESGYEVELMEEIALLHEEATRAVKHIFSAKIIGGELNFSQEEMLDAGWFSFKEIEAMKDKLRSDWIFKIILTLQNK